MLPELGILWKFITFCPLNLVGSKKGSNFAANLKLFKRKDRL